MEVIDENVFPFLRSLGQEGSSYGRHMRDDRLGSSSPALPCPARSRSRNARQIPMEDPREDSPDAEPADGQAWRWSTASFVELWLLRLIVV